MVHSRTKDPEKICRLADILIVAAGKMHLIDKNFVKGAVIIDVGIHRHDGKLQGDVDYESVFDHCSAITPVPGGQSDDHRYAHQ